MRCFHVFIHGKLTWNAALADSGELPKPSGFYCHRYVLASDESKAMEQALHRVREDLDKQTDWLREGLANLDLEAVEISAAPMHKLLTPDNLGHTFYAED